MFSENLSIFPDVSPSSPTTAFTALQPLPLSPPEDTEQLCVDASGPLSPTLYRLNAAATTAPPARASQLWDAVPTAPPAGAPMATAPLSQNNFMTLRRRLPLWQGTLVSQLFQSSSALPVSHVRPLLLLVPAQVRPYTTRPSESISDYDDRDGTVRKK